jgi:hypothetical protein
VLESAGGPASLREADRGSVNKTAEREPYERPKVVRVRIISGEMAVTGCKVRNGNTGPTLGCQRTACRSMGS